jgi:hypothetical protein
VELVLNALASLMNLELLLVNIFSGFNVPFLHFSIVMLESSMVGDLIFSQVSILKDPSLIFLAWDMLVTKEVNVVSAHLFHIVKLLWREMLLVSIDLARSGLINVAGFFFSMEIVIDSLLNVSA